MKGECFICSLDQSVFQRKANGFEPHIKRDHNMWQYLFYFLYLFQKSETEYTAQESYVHEMIEKESISFFPIQRAMVVPDENDTEQLELIDNKLERLTINHKNLAQKFDQSQKDVQEKLTYIVENIRSITQNFDELKGKK